MKTKFHYVPHLLVDMRGPEFCGEFNSCFAGGTVCRGCSCSEDSSCMGGMYAERCQAGTSACGCDSCCQDGSGWTTSSGLPFMLCECKGGGQAKMNCNVGSYTGGACSGGNFAGVAACFDGGYVDPGLGTEWCGEGYGGP